MTQTAKVANASGDGAMGLFLRRVLKRPPNRRLLLRNILLMLSSLPIFSEVGKQHRLYRKNSVASKSMRYPTCELGTSGSLPTSLSRSTVQK